MVVGAIQGAVLGLLISLATGKFHIFFPFDILAGAAVLSAVIGYIFGERVVEYLTDLIRKILDYIPHGPN
ncbi:MAG: hypothetical protein KDA85_04355 [Planctomycetaceae bacterium]|nr:hypothetical protein [Planctomycetaceae bacterium]